jgi:hypothetical protein
VKPPGSARLHLFQELSTLGQQLTRPLVLCAGLGRIKPMYPTGTPRPRYPFPGARSGTSTAVHTAFAIAGHRHALPRPALAAHLGAELWYDFIAISRATSHLYLSLRVTYIVLWSSFSTVEAAGERM